MKKFAVLLTAIALLLSICIPAAVTAENKTVKIVTTIFPIYDWVREIAGSETDMELTMLLDSGVDLHNYQPTAQDILKIAQCDLFIFVGGESDEWTEDVIATAQNKDMIAISLLDALGEDVKEEEIVEGMEHEHHHDEDEDHDEHHHDEHDHDEHEHHHEDEEKEFDEHVWLSLRNAEKLTKAIADALCEINPDAAEMYQANEEKYLEKLIALDAEYEAAVKEAAYKTVLFGDRFPFRYMMDDYGLTYFAAFTGCSAETEASFQTILFLAQKLDELGLPAVLTIENPKTRMPETIVSSTQAKNQKILSMNSMQGVTAQEVKEGVTYLSVMESNLTVLKEALN
ncbi:MAG: zinc ABC transporter substrate-binding protein [Clostridia bacterium]|nr:zinc ABC transporter substrate-binding protein [Clostridia bacterium]